MTAEHTLGARDLHLGYDGQKVVEGLDLDVPPGRVTMIVGPNACGKSTTLRAMARLLAPTSGQILLDGKDIQKTPTKEVASVLGILPQTPVAPDGIIVSDLVGRGRYPHQGWLRKWTAEDDQAVAEAMRATSVLELASRPVEALSGGQRQRVWIAMALAQRTDLLLLDEPTTYLDVAHQLEVLDLLIDLNTTRGTTVVVVLHDLNLACRYADHLIAMRAGKVMAVGDPREVVTAGLIEDIFGMRCSVVPDPISGSPMIVPIGRHRVATETG
ncbi:cobalamin/Fe3+-siderophore ABC transporter ATP-binding protein [Kineosporia sp. NBRC 101677]|uniref:ABC transporter ATP-binding protein n=1 Tax=Kineosporia sp. NBRC 101677 TaxID=3032197 RepID=UPI0024A4264A|nr:ABC transporter ATP-binding protein [Kineosporia sp. NBRC 101677]GLY15954.1 cobalamin/Fe3+-siderophore ABC transporter ATP-binding protein [Kineosporia sp. NBRC 101677]